ncbi:N-acetylmuramoyl-L-alanine amidase [Stigmatella aurantiaca]|uniref:N-acetylmuramoyl-L-alanine amidase n=1 Tax=Stigmatella aurantiaca TaxID=41 RepID=A0A1H8BM02_STIAU|nr:N-acetylmuramoyl-L-alanine amidase [Stigmatella aurantiaca]SEM83826.1 N-acetylmuramoyl-L-alanine amidase [Stigmatella aurantiaca]
MARLRSGHGPVLALLLLPAVAAAQAPLEDPLDCGLDPPGRVYVPRPGPRAHEAAPWTDREPTLVRRELRDSGMGTRSGVPQTRLHGGALSGKTIYLSPGHGFYRSAPLARWATQRPNTFGVVEDFVSAETLNQYLLPMLMGAGAVVVPVREPDLNPRMAIVNNGDPGYSEQGDPGLFSTSPVPGWGPPPSPMANNVLPFQLGGSRVMTAAAQATASASWVPNIPEDGARYVYIAYTSDPSRVHDAHFVVRHAGGESHFRINQRRHGGTWVMLGRFYFKAGQSPEKGAVQALNDSTAQGGVSLDAVRFGGGTGFIGDAEMGPVPRPRYEECARYHTQFSGAPASVFAPSGTNRLSNERNDDVTARSRFAAWDHEEGEDAVYVAWHTNASGAGAYGTEGYVYGPNPVDGTLNFTGVPGSDVMAQALLDELDHDLKATVVVDPPWRTRKLRSAYFGEVNPAHNPEMPSVLLEIAYHDSERDAVHLREADFRRVAARAILQGLIKYFAKRDGAPVHLPPEPPTAVAALNKAGGVEVRWAASPTDSDDVGGHAATAYRVYQSEDGLGWDEGHETAETAFTMALPPGTTRYFRVAALNAGGESFPSETVGVRTGEAPPVLIINAFDRLDATMNLTEDLTPYDLGSPVRVLLEAMNDGSSIRRHGAAVARHAVAFDSATNEAFAAKLTNLTGYRLVDWFTGRGGVKGAPPTRDEQVALRDFVSKGGHLLFSGSNAASQLLAGSAEDQAFLADILRATVGSSGTSSLLVEGQPGQWLAPATNLALDDGTRGGLAVGVTDVLAPAGGALPVLRYAGTEFPAGVASAPGGQVLFLGIPLEGIVSPWRREYVMGAFLARTGLLATEPAAPGDEPPLPDLGPANQWTPATGNDVRPPDPLPPPYVVGEVPESYEAADTGCGCGAGSAPVFMAWWGLLVTVQLQRARRRTPHSSR